MKKLLFFAICLIPFIGNAQSAQEIMQKSQDVMYKSGSTMKADIKMTVVKKGGSWSPREMKMIRKNFGNDQKYLVRLSTPNDWRGTALLVYRNTTRIDDMWLYQPSFRNVNRLSTKNRRNKFVQSDTVYEDIVGRDLNRDTHTIFAESETAWRIESRVKNVEYEEFTRYVTVIEKGTNLTMEIIYYDGETEKPIRTITTMNAQREMKYPYATLVEIKNVRDGTQTLIEYSNVLFDTPIPDAQFTERALTSGN